MEIELKCNVFDLDFHPSTNIVAIGLATGKLSLYDYADEATPKKLLQVKAHTKTCHALRFVNEGRVILTGSSDCSILSIDVETGSKIARLDHAHGDTINKIVNLTESTIASGDNGGCIKIWDTRQRSCCNTFSIHQDYISDMSFASESMKLIGTSGDGTLSVCNLRSNKVQTQSEFSEDELLSVVIMKNGRKVICGTQSGTLLLYSWGFFKDCSDRFVGLCPNSVNTMLKLDEDRIIIGSENGIISLVGILPNRIIQPIAEHHSIHSVERLAFSHDKKFIGSISEEETLKIWDLDELLLGSTDTMSNNSVSKDSDRDGMEVDENVSIPSKGTKTKNGSKRSNLSNLFYMRHNTKVDGRKRSGDRMNFET